MDSKDRLLGLLINAYVDNANMYKSLKPSSFDRHIKGIEESDMVLMRQEHLQKVIVKAIDTLINKESNLPYGSSPFVVRPADIETVLKKR